MGMNLTATRKWVYFSALAVMLLVGGWSIAEHGSARAALAEQRNNGADVTPAEREARKLLGKAERPGSLEEADWQRLLTLFNGPDKRGRSAAISVMMCLGKSSRRDEILRLIRPLLTSGGSIDDETSALEVLMRFDTSDWRRQVALRENRPEPLMKYVVGLIKQSGRY